MFVFLLVFFRLFGFVEQLVGPHEYPDPEINDLIVKMGQEFDKEAGKTEKYDPFNQVTQKNVKIPYF